MNMNVNAIECVCECMAYLSRITRRAVLHAYCIGISAILDGIVGLSYTILMKSAQLSVQRSYLFTRSLYKTNVTKVKLLRISYNYKRSNHHFVYRKLIKYL